MLYAVFLWATQRRRDATVNPGRSRASPRSRIVALLLVLGSFIYFAHFTGAPPGSTYVPAHIEDGKFVPGQNK